MQWLRNILFPFSILYGGIVWLRNKLFDWNVLKSERFKVPVVCVGNLNVGGTGKSPMVEYLIRLLKENYHIATLSRGYKRQTKGFKLVEKNSFAKDVGDEPLQFKQKFKDIVVAVDEKRANGIKQLLELSNKPNVILLDDAFQHRYVEPHFTILLTAYQDLYVDDFMLPTGNLREPKSGAKRATIIVVTKCPSGLDSEIQQVIIKRLNPNPNQKVFFSTISYSEKILSNTEERHLDALNANKFTLVTGIANPKPLVNYLKSKELDFEHLNFSDHHHFSDSEIRRLKKEPLILTTEKDYMRLKQHLKNSQLFYLPISAKLMDETNFKTVMTKYL